MDNIVKRRVFKTICPYCKTYFKKLNKYNNKGFSYFISECSHRKIFFYANGSTAVFYRYNSTWLRDDVIIDFFQKNYNEKIKHEFKEPFQTAFNFGQKTKEFFNKKNGVKNV
jgi:hypothetical protein